MSQIVWLGDMGCDEPRSVGGKAAQLSRLSRYQAVPAGFCLTAGASRTDRDEASAAVPAALSQLVRDAYTELGRKLAVIDPAVAVRSSAIDEDGALASFAGIYTTYLNVRGSDAVLAAIARCWASAKDPRVIEYRRQRGSESAGLAVIVQDLVAADSSAVVFSANPTTGATDQIVINANYGLGESVVGGLATPDSWAVRKSDLSSLRFVLGHKEQMTILSAEGTREVPVLPTLRRRPCLSAAQVGALARLALQLESAMGWPVDIECAFRGDSLYLLQCRPITALAVP